MNFECHITLVPKDEPFWVEAIEDISAHHKFKTSFITGDPLLGKAKYFYLTAHDESYDQLFKRMSDVVNSLPLGSKPVRLKIEQILYDKRF